jgi:WD repeat-containing protein 48
VSTAGRSFHSIPDADHGTVNVGKWVLRNLFIGFIREQLHLKKSQEAPSMRDGSLPPSVTRNEHDRTPTASDSPRKTRHRPSASLDSTGRRRSRHNLSPQSAAVVNSPKMIPAVPPVITNFPRSSPLLTPLIPIIPAKEMLPTITQSPMASPIAENTPATPSAPTHQRSRSGTVDGSFARTPSTGAGNDYFTLRTRQQSLSGSEDTPQAPGTPKAEPQTPSTPGGFMGRLKSFGKIAKRPVSDTASPILGAMTPTAETIAASEVGSPHLFSLIFSWNQGAKCRVIVERCSRGS